MGAIADIREAWKREAAVPRRPPILLHMNPAKRHPFQNLHDLSPFYPLSVLILSLHNECTLEEAEAAWSAEREQEWWARIAQLTARELDGAARGWTLYTGLYGLLPAFFTNQCVVWRSGAAVPTATVTMYRAACVLASPEAGGSLADFSRVKVPTVDGWMEGRGEGASPACLYSALRAIAYTPPP